MENEALYLLKTVADETRIRILRALYEKDYYVELLAERLNLSPATGTGTSARAQISANNASESASVA